MLRLAETYAEALAQPGRQSSDQAGDSNVFFFGFEQYWFNKALSDAIEGQAPLEQGLAEAQKPTTAYMGCLAKNLNKPATCVMQVDPSYQGYFTEDPLEGAPRG
jgi:hypothetical protein